MGKRRIRAATSTSDLRGARSKLSRQRENLRGAGNQPCPSFRRHKLKAAASSQHRRSPVSRNFRGIVRTCARSSQTSALAGTFSTRPCCRALYLKLDSQINLNSHLCKSESGEVMTTPPHITRFFEDREVAQESRPVRRRGFEETRHARTVILQRGFKINLNLAPQTPPFNATRRRAGRIAPDKRLPAQNVRRATGQFYAKFDRQGSVPRSLRIYFLALNFSARFIMWEILCMHSRAIYREWRVGLRR
jgi:hypothetical protein